LNLEHSYLGDLNLRLICPNGQSTLLHGYPSPANSSYFLGNPIDDDANLATHGRSTPDEKPWLNKGSEQFKSAIAYIQGGGSIEAIKGKYKVSKEIENLLLNQ
jgi:hypothetical protein